MNRTQEHFPFDCIVKSAHLPTFIVPFCPKTQKNDSRRPLILIYKKRVNKYITACIKQEGRLIVEYAQQNHSVLLQNRPLDKS